MGVLDDMGSDYPMGDEKTYQNRQKYGSSVHPNSRAGKMAKRIKALQKKQVSTSDGYMKKK